MRQLLIRVPDELHSQLTQRAAREGRSVNALVNEVLVVAGSVERGSRQDRLRTKATALGLLASERSRAVRVEPGRRREVIAAMQGVGTVVDETIDADRDRR